MSKLVNLHTLCLENCITALLLYSIYHQSSIPEGKVQYNWASDEGGGKLNAGLGHMNEAISVFAD